MPANSDTDIGLRVRRLREERGWSQARLAELLPGVKQQSIDQLEQGRIARPRFLPELAAVLGVQEKWLLSGTGKKAAPLAEAEIDAHLLRDVVSAVETCLQSSKVRFDHAEKARLIAALYELMLAETRVTPEKLADAANNIVSYERLLQRGKR